MVGENVWLAKRSGGVLDENKVTIYILGLTVLV